MYLKNKKIDEAVIKKMVLYLNTLTFEEKRALRKLLVENLYERKVEVNAKSQNVAKRHEEIYKYMCALMEEAKQGFNCKYVARQFFYDTTAEVFGITPESVARIYNNKLKSKK